MKSTDDLLKEREKTHGDHKDVYNFVWALWYHAIDSKEFMGLEGWRKVEYMMALFKIGRGVFNPLEEDNPADGAGYLRLIQGEIHNYKKNENNLK